MKLTTGSNFDNAITKRNIETLLFEVQVELYRMAIIKMVPAIERIGDEFIKDVISIASQNNFGYFGFARAFANAMKRIPRPKVNISQPATTAIAIHQNRAIIVKLQLVQWSVRELNKQTRQEIKRSFLTGQKMRFNTPGTHPGLGWWYYFENGSAARNWGSNKFGFLPGLNGGGRMVTLESLKARNPRGKEQLQQEIRRINKLVEMPKETTAGELWNLTDPDRTSFTKQEDEAFYKIVNNSKFLDRVVMANKRERMMAKAIKNRAGHPGVFKIGMFAKALQIQKNTLELKIQQAYKAALDSISPKDIDLAFSRVLSKRGLAGVTSNDPYARILKINKAQYPSLKPPYNSQKSRQEHANKVENYNVLQKLYERIGAI